jgi:hypothetical protein
MAISNIIANITKYISEAAMRIFGPNDDAYPDKRKDHNN